MKRRRHTQPDTPYAHVARPPVQVPTKPSKAVVAAVITLLGLVGIQVTTGTAQALVMLGQLVLVVYGVWRTRNPPKLPNRGRSVGEYQ